VCTWKWIACCKKEEKKRLIFLCIIRGCKKCLRDVNIPI